MGSEMCIRDSFTAATEKFIDNGLEFEKYINNDGSINVDGEEVNEKHRPSAITHGNVQEKLLWCWTFKAWDMMYSIPKWQQST